MIVIRNKNVVARQIDDATFLIDITENYSNDKCSLYEINEVGAFIWTHLSKAISLTNIIEIVASVIIDDVTRDVLANDIQEFIDSLIRNGFVEVLDK